MDRHILGRQVIPEFVLEKHEAKQLKIVLRNCGFINPEDIEEYIAVGGYPVALAPRNFAPFVVPAGEYFMLGDNRDDSFDSRFWGTVKREKIVGRATTVVLSLDKSNYWLPRWQRSYTSLETDLR